MSIALRIAREQRAPQYGRVRTEKKSAQHISLWR